MAVMIKCKMCGGDLHITEGSTVCECEYCGTKQTVPTLDNEKKLTLFSRAGRLLRNCEFDKASGVFESIVAEFPEEAEAYWGLVLCKYGIEYVDDPATGKKIPTCHRSSFDSVLDDVNFEQACENTDAVARRVYRDEARQLEELRKSIIEVSGKEEPYDIFISYKETDENGNRTLDSVIAQDIYTELTEKGYRVFFSRISLEDKLGVEYEPYIFAALNSAKVMLVVGTDYENFDAVWVKNEWSRFLKLIAGGQKKVLIPVFKNMDPYDMPKEFSKLAAQDMGKVGAMQDLLRGVEKLVDKKLSTRQMDSQAINMVSNSPTVTSLLERAFMFLEDGDIAKVKEYVEKVLDIEPRNARAFLCKMLIGLKLRNKESLSQLKKPLDNNLFYQKILQSGDQEVIEELNGYNDVIKKRIRATEEAERKKQEEKNNRIAELKEELARLREQKANPGILLEGNEKEEYEVLLRKKVEAEREEKEKTIVLEKAEKQIAEIEQQISEKQIYFTSLGIFKGNEKRVVQQEIKALKQNHDSKLSELNGLKREADNTHSKLSVVINSLENFEQQALRDKIESTIIQIRKLNHELIEYEKELVFGSYHGEKIEWLVLNIENNKALVISKYALDSQPYNSSFADVTWEKCTIRTWLNDPFLKMAFSPEEQKQIMMVTVVTERKPFSRIDLGNYTEDKIFLLSALEVNKYFPKDTTRQCKPTKFAKMQRCYVDKTQGNCWWWLRTPGNNQNSTVGVSTNGSVRNSGYDVSFSDGAVRPAMWISLDT